MIRKPSSTSRRSDRFGIFGTKAPQDGNERKVGEAFTQQHEVLPRQNPGRSLILG